MVRRTYQFDSRHVNIPRYGREFASKCNLAFSMKEVPISCRKTPSQLAAVPVIRCSVPCAWAARISKPVSLNHTTHEKSRRKQAPAGMRATAFRNSRDASERASRSVRGRKRKASARMSLRDAETSEYYRRHKQH